MSRLDSERIGYLARGWSALRLAVESPERFPSWDAVILTAASEAQARLYDRRLAEARASGRLPPRTLAFAAPDPGGVRIGSGGATLNALRMLAERVGAARAPALRTLLIHSGGDSRRVPWANIFGKVFLPLPALADPDCPVPTLFDHLVAALTPLSFALCDGGLVTLAGDVLPLFDAAAALPPADAGWVVVTPAPLDLAGRHGVIVGAPDGRVSRLLQKAGPEALAAGGALIEGGSALLDTGIWAFTGAVYRALVETAAARPGAFDLALEEGASPSLYEEIAAALVPEQRATLEGRRWARPLLEAWRNARLVFHRADEMMFLHFGTTAETLDHLDRPWYGALRARLLSEDGPLADPDAHIIESCLHPETRVGAGSLVFGARLGPDTAIGRRCVVIDVDDSGEAFALPDNTCLWQAHLQGGNRVVWLCCGVDDSPNDPFETAIFCNRDFKQWMSDHDVSPEELWQDGVPRTLWTARLFPVLEAPASLQLTAWMVGAGSGDRRRNAWKAAERLSMAELHARTDFERGQRERDNRRSELALRAVHRVVAGGLDRNLRALAEQIIGAGRRERVFALAEREILGRADLAESRQWQMRSDLLGAGGDAEAARDAADRAFTAVQSEVARAVAWEPPAPVRGLPQRAVTVELPVRFDISGGWSDTPPYCLERPARVLNFALLLDGRRPVRVEAETLEEPVWELENQDLRARARVENPADVRSDDFSDPFLLVRTALFIMGFAAGKEITQGVRLRTHSGVPRGSGLGTSSILGAAVIRALALLANRPDDWRSVSDLVLVLEQRMRTGGGWQDQAGGLIPGVKCVSTRPVRPLRMTVEPVPLLPRVRAEFEQRFVVVFTGQQRLARNILQIVVERYLRREARTLEAIRRLVELADEGRSALAMGDLDDLGRVLGEAWQALQQLTPECSNPNLDRLFHAIAPWSLGGKLAGAGGGGFMGVMARDAEAANLIRAKLTEIDPAIRSYRWSLDEG